MRFLETKTEFLAKTSCFIKPNKYKHIVICKRLQTTISDYKYLSTDLFLGVAATLPRRKSETRFGEYDKRQTDITCGNN